MNAVFSARTAAAALVSVTLASCGSTPKADTATTRTDSASVTAAAAHPADTAWRALFDGTSLGAFRGYKQQTMPGGWAIVGDTLVKSKGTNDVITRDQFGNFELTFDWKLSPGGNAGIFYRGTEEYDHIYWSAPEYQLLDDAKHPDGKSRLTSAGAAYALYPSPAGIVKPGGQWNSSRLIVNGAHVEHWLNGQKLLSYELWSPDWEAKVKASKFSAYPNYGRAHRGYIGIQGDHDGTLMLRNIRIREIPQ
jgi:hypothetical protein